VIKLLALTLFTGLSMSAATVVSAAAFLVTGGVALCRVETPEVNLTLPFPTHLADLGLLIARVAMPEEELADVRQEVEPYIPMIDGVLRELADVPNGTVLVAVSSPDETVVVDRRGGRFRVDVDSRDVDVHVSIPARSVKRLARQLSEFL